MYQSVIKTTTSIEKVRPTSINLLAKKLKLSAVVPKKVAAVLVLLASVELESSTYIIIVRIGKKKQKNDWVVG
jgi:hypothetical protein